VESTDEERRRRFVLRWHLNTLFLRLKQPSWSFLLSPAPPVSRVGGRSSVTILVFLASVLTLAALIAGLFAFQQGRTGYAQLPPTLTPGGPVVPGGLLSIYGGNFSSGGSVTITIDEHAVAIAHAASSHQASYSVYTSTSPSLLAYSAGQLSVGAMLVKSDGTFDATIMIDAKWSIGSAHKLIATEASNGLTASLALVVLQPAALLGCSKSTNSTTLVLGPVDDGQKQSTSATFKLCTIGSGTVNWTASWDHQQAEWLQLDSSGKIVAPLSKQFTITASSSGLKAGMYSTTVTFSSQGSSVKVFLNVTLIVRAHTGTCVNTNPQSVAFTATQGRSNPAPQTVTITNCGSNGSWTASTHTDDGANWLHVSPMGGILKSKATQAVTITASSAELTVGTSTGQVTFKIGASRVAVNITLTVQQSQSCITTNPQSLTFTAVQDQSPPGSQVTTVVNCGIPGSWLASILTTDGTNWLSINPSQGRLDVNTSQDVSISVSNANLQVGIYTGQVSFTLGSSKQIVNITLTVQKQQAKPCLTVSPQALSFTSTQGLGDPALQTLMLTNCGPTDSWSAAVSTADDAMWLTVSAATGNLNSGTSQAISIAVSSGNLGAGKYTGQVAFTTSADAKAVVNVTWVMQPPPSCIQADPSSQTFTAVQGLEGGNATQSQPVRLTNCGEAGTWMASTSTTDGGSWLFITGYSSGSLDAGATDTNTTSIGINSTNLEPGKYQGTATFTITTSTGSNSAAVSVTLTITLPPVQRQISSTQTQSQIVDATGSRQTDATNAIGFLTFTNEGSGPKSYPAGSIYESNNRVQIAIDTDANVLAPDPLKGLSFVTVPAHAVNPGAAGNIAEEDVNTSLDTYITITNYAAFTGGQDAQTYTFVQKSDIDRTTTSLENSTQQSAIDDIYQQLQPNEHLVGNPQCTSNVSPDSNNPDRVVKESVTVTTMCKATAST